MMRTLTRCFGFLRETVGASANVSLKVRLARAFLILIFVIVTISDVLWMPIPPRIRFVLRPVALVLSAVYVVTVVVRSIRSRSRRK